LNPTDDDRLVPVSPRHCVRLAREYLAILDKPPRRDYVVRTVVSRQANGLPLMSAEIVIASAETRAAYPLAEQYPLHFRKTYFPARMHGDPAVEFERQAEASALVGLPPPIGHGPDTFRSCLVPGVPYSRVSPFAANQEDADLRTARELPLAAAAGLYHLAERGFELVTALQRAGLSHGDAELHNFIVCPSPLEMLLVDFESAARRESVSDEAWEKRCSTDLEPLLREALLLECRLGAQPGAFAELAWQRLDRLFKDASRFRREIDQQANLAP
jgi:hypothetical protein